MFQSMYDKTLTIVFVIVVIAAVILIGFLGYDYYSRYKINKDQSDYVDEFISEVTSSSSTSSSSDSSNESSDSSSFDKVERETTTVSNTSSVKTYKGYPTIGTIEVPKVGYKYAVLGGPISDDSLNTSVHCIYGTELNQAGNVVIIGHNYRNDTFFAKNDKLVVGDKIYLTDLTGTKMCYTIYSKEIKEANDASFYTRDTNGEAEVTLSTCTNDGKQRIIIFAKADQSVSDNSSDSSEETTEDAQE